jgi:type I restriction enzyme, S subunit
VSTKRRPLRPLARCAKFLSGGTPSKARAEFWEGDIPWVSSGEMAQTRIHDTSLHITAEAAEDGSRLVPANTVLAVVRGMSLAKEFRVAITKREVAFNQDLKAFACESDVDSEFLFYALFARREHIRELSTEASHGTKKLETDVLAAFRLLVPTPDLQRRAVARIVAYDDLMENNRRRMALLEEAARLLYREWFVRLRFPGHEHTRIIDGVPEGWERKKLGDVLTLKRGYDLPAADRVPGDIPIVSSSGITGFHNAKKADAPGVVTGRYGTLGQVYFIDREYWPLNTALYVSDFKGNPAHFLVHFLRHALQGAQSDKAAVPGLNRNVAHSLTVLWPSRALRDQFDDFTRLTYQQLGVLNATNEKLRTARDLLLPRLMSGEIAV